MDLASEGQAEPRSCGERAKRPPVLRLRDSSRRAASFEGKTPGFSKAQGAPDRTGLRSARAAVPPLGPRILPPGCRGSPGRTRGLLSEVPDTDRVTGPGGTKGPSPSGREGNPALPPRRYGQCHAARAAGIKASGGFPRTSHGASDSRPAHTQSHPLRPGRGGENGSSEWTDTPGTPEWWPGKPADAGPASLTKQGKTHLSRQRRDSRMFGTRPPPADRVGRNSGVARDGPARGGVRAGRGPSATA